MKFFIDTADINEIRTAVSYGLIDGVTTNPSLVAKTGKDLNTVLNEICAVVNGPISAEVVSTDAEGMIAEGRKLAGINNCIVIKVPMTLEGLKATRVLSEEQIGVNVTLVFSPIQALMAAKAGAAYVSPFIGRLDDIGQAGMDLVEQTLTIFDNYSIDTEIIVASIRNPVHVLEAALLGADIATIPFSVINQLAKHPLTDIGLQRFLEDWKKVPQK
ncbi:MAG TPA: fructose-6-phosphate aldolase [Thermodesulfobacteriota bacterium]|nr:fructose-6-phosphate aldolase [Deltaproteobacteria bacterium]HNU70636.1 fructose-6-phosphate aldolase [Thermodesulfobacteriota bacterium]HOC38057.1 fructose-6-phosphate aldolase [Thermodesulfobacteriota bacterium]HQO77229.1 fructose-6-phosphate aldolase [Thermodesulfobacteriota bacterium]